MKNFRFMTIFSLVSLFVGCSGCIPLLKNQEKKEQAKDGTDKHGRSSDHPHYKHGHPPQDQQEVTDEYGRPIDHPHYKHDHPPQDQKDQQQEPGEN